MVRFALRIMGDKRVDVLLQQGLSVLDVVIRGLDCNRSKILRTMIEMRRRPGRAGLSVQCAEGIVKICMGRT